MGLHEHRTGWTYHQPASCSTAQEKWDDQIRLNREGVNARRRWIPLLRRLGLHWWARRIHRDTRATLAIADRMEACPNNPRNGGDGYGVHEGTDRRTGYVYQGKYLIVRYPLGDPSECQVELLDDTREAHAALQQLRDESGRDLVISLRPDEGAS